MEVMSDQKARFTNLGNHLKYIREQARESLAEVSGAVEIDEQYLQRIEEGLERPAEDILLLLISHFGVKDHEAVQMWESADYDSDMPDVLRPEHEVIQLTGKSLVMLVAGEIRTIYSDGVEITANSAGITMNFTQSRSASTPVPVARIGMSQTQAEQVLADLQRALLHARYNSGHKLLPPPEQN
jgi:transcriptional regulator with XRE-family HTH domain